MNTEALIVLATAFANLEDCKTCGTPMMFWTIDEDGNCPKCTKYKRPGPFYMCDNCGTIKPLKDPNKKELCSRCGTVMSQIRFCRFCGRTIIHTKEDTCSYCLSQALTILCTNCNENYSIPRHLAHKEHTCPWCGKKMNRFDL